jgi:hypothetical protein
MSFITAKEFFETNPESVSWIVKPWLSCEAITELDGKAKSAGKTTFTLAMCGAILGGKDFLGEVSQCSPIVYLTEESGPSFRAALDRAGIGPHPDFHILRWSHMFKMHDGSRSDSMWARTVDQAVQHAQVIGAKVLVIDTFAQFAGLMGDKENSAGDVLEAMQPLQRARDAGLAVLLIRHERKEGGGVGDSGRGSSALSGAVDIILRLHRPEGRHAATIRQIDAASRFDDTPAETTIELIDGKYELVGDRDAVAFQAAIQSLRSITPLGSANALGLTDLSKITGSSRTTLQSAISLLLPEGWLIQQGRGVKGDPIRFYRNDAETPSP